MKEEGEENGQEAETQSGYLAVASRSSTLIRTENAKGCELALKTAIVFIPVRNRIQNVFYFSLGVLNLPRKHVSVQITRNQGPAGQMTSTPILYLSHLPCISVQQSIKEDNMRRSRSVQGKGRP